MVRAHIIVVGGGVGGLTAAALVGAAGHAVTVLERASQTGGKVQEVDVEGARIDTGPTVLTKRHVFDEIFAAAGADLDQHLKLVPLDVLARHAWPDGTRLDLHADVMRSRDAIAAFAGGVEADGFMRFSADAARTYRTLDAPFMAIERPSLPGMLARIAARGLPGLVDMWRLQPYASLWRELGRYFRDVRLRQLFARYATYCGASPFLAPATLMLVAHLEQQGVWIVEGGMQRLADALADLARGQGAAVHTGCHVDEILVEGGVACGVRLATGEIVRGDAVVFNGDMAALGRGLLGRVVARGLERHGRAARSLSAVTLSFAADARGFPLAHHSVFFSDDYAAEFDAIFDAGAPPKRPTIYVCAPDHAHPERRQRLFCLMNAPATGDGAAPTPEEIEQWQHQTLTSLRRCGLMVEARSGIAVSTPFDFHRRFPGTGGALYGPASHTVMAAFQRAGSRARVKNLYLCGGSLHPGPGLPMAAQSGRLAAHCLLADLASIRTSHRVATPGGTSMASVTTERMR